MKSISKLGEGVGKGRTAELFNMDNGRVIKLFYEEFTHIADYEYKINLKVQDVYDNVPKAYDMIEIEGRQGIVYDYIEGRTLVDIATTQPLLVLKQMKEFTELHAEMHKCTISGLDDLHTDLKEIITKSKYLDKRQKEFVLRKLNSLPIGNVLCHMDYHPDNIMKTEEGLIVIDWITAANGNQLADVARTKYLLRRGTPTQNTSFFERTLIKIFQLFVSRIYLKTYRKLTGIRKKDLQDWEIIIQAARLSENIPEEEEFIYKNLKKLMRNY